MCYRDRPINIPAEPLMLKNARQRRDPRIKLMADLKQYVVVVRASSLSPKYLM